MSPATQREIDVSKVKLVGLVILGAVIGVVEAIVLFITGVPA